MHGSDLLWFGLLRLEAVDRRRRYGRAVLTSAAPDGVSRAVMGALVDACTEAGCIPPPRANDLQLACGVLSPPGPVLSPPMPRRPRSAMPADLVAPLLGASVHRDVGVRLDTDPEDVHQLRVATRRLRADRAFAART